jgi:hypothetical protein
MVVFIVLLFGVVMFSQFWRLTLPAIILAYVLSGPIYVVYRLIRGRGLLGRRLAIAERRRRSNERATKETATKVPD